ncbi:hypothetical protein AB1Y20_014892 [Prymnesium parvum]|uniref:Coiled-coil domain-containing protein 77 n=1 Tax=Prymnesium parvum TaxID=97485 RepID=A0AB34K0V7_PRYPA
MPCSPSTLAELERVPLSEELLQYYRSRVNESEAELSALTERIDSVAQTHEAQHKAWWEVHQRMNEIADLQKALSDSHVYLWEERERCHRLQAEVDELKLQEVEDRRKIQHLLSLVGPVVQDVMYIRDAPPETITLHPYSRATTSAAPAAAHRNPSHAARAPSGLAPPAPAAPASASSTGVPLSRSGPSTLPSRLSAEGTRVLRTVYLPNEQVDSLLLTIEALRAQLQEQERLGRERVSALLEDRRLRMAEESARRTAESERLQELEQDLARAQTMLVRYTKDFLKLKHEARQKERRHNELVASLTQERDESIRRVDELRQAAALEVQAAVSASKMSGDNYVSLYRQQVSDTERTMGLLKDQHHGLQQALAMRVKELEAVVQRLRQQFRELDERRGLEIEGFNNEVALLQKQVARLELKAYGRKLMERPVEMMAPRATAGAKTSQCARNVRSMKTRIAALEKSMLIDEVV